MVVTKSLEDAKKLFMQEAEFGGARREIIGGYPVAEAASKMPWMNEDEFRELQISIHEEGLYDEIELNGSDEIVDGRNRLLACLALDVEPGFCHSKASDDVTIVDVRNLKRRNIEPSRRAMIYLLLHGRELIDSEADSETSTSPQHVDDAAQASSTENAQPVEESAEPKSRKKASRTMPEHAKEAGVSERTLRSATVVVRQGVEQLKEAALTGEIPVSTAADIARKPPEEQRSAVEEHTAGTRGAERRKKSDAQFDFESWGSSVEKRLSKILASVPADLRDRAHRRLAETFGSTVRLERDTADMLNSEGIVPYVEQIVDEMPKSERVGAEKALAERYGSVVGVKDADSAVTKIKSIIESLNAREQKIVAAALREQYASSPMKASEYLPKLPDDHTAACEVVKKEVKARFDQLVGFEEWEVNSRRAAARSLKTSVLGQVKKLVRHAGLESEDDPALIETKYPEHLDTDSFRLAWKEWLAAKKLQKKPVSVATQTRQLNILAHFDSEQAVEILTKAMQKPWEGIPVFRELATTDWAGRQPAFPPEGFEPAPQSRIPNVPVKTYTAPDRSKHGRLDTSRVPVSTTLKEKIAAIDD